MKKDKLYKLEVYKILMNDREIVRNTCLTSLSIIRILFVNSPNDKDTKDLI